MACGGLCGAAPPPLRADWDEIKARGTLRVITFVDERRPEFFSGKTKAPGFDHELLHGFASLHKLKLEIVDEPGGSEVRIAALLAGKGDVVAGRLAVTAERREVIDYTQEVFPLRFVVMSRKPGAAITTVSELRRQRVGVSRTPTLLELMKTAGVPSSKIESFSEPSLLADGLKSGRVTAVVWGIDIALPALIEDPDLEMAGFIGSPTSQAYGVRKTDPGLLKRLDGYVGYARQGGTWSRLAVKYFGSSALEILKKAREASDELWTPIPARPAEPAGSRKPSAAKAGVRNRAARFEHRPASRGRGLAGPPRRTSPSETAGDTGVRYADFVRDGLICGASRGGTAPN